MSKTLFVGGLSWNTTDDGLRSAFAKFGEITESRVVTDRATGRSRGFGFVTYTQDQDALNAIQGMNGTELEGRMIRVNEAEQREPRSGGDRPFRSNNFRDGGDRGGFGGGGGGGGQSRRRRFGGGGGGGGGGGYRGGGGGRDNYRGNHDEGHES